MRWFVVVVVILVSAVLVLLGNQRRMLREGDALLITGKPLMAISMYERALLNYVPFSTYNQEAIEKIEKLCPKLKEKEHRLFCYETLRSALYQLRGFYTPYSEKIKDLDKKIILTKLELYIEHNNPPQEKYEQIFRELKAMTDYDPYPSVFWSAIVVFSLAGWIFSVVLVVLKGFGFSGRIILVGAFSFVIFFCLWLLGLYMA